MRADLRLRISMIAMVLVLAVMAPIAVLLVGFQRRALTDHLDDQVLSNSETVETRLLTGDLGSSFLVPGDEDNFGLVIDTSGKILASTPNMVGQPVPVTFDSGAESAWRNARLPIYEGRYRILARRVQGAVIYIGTPLDDVDESVATLRTGLLWAGPAASVALGLLMWWLVGLTLRPVERMRARVAGISGSNLHLRVPETKVNDEIGRLAKTMNAMLARVEDAAVRQRQFVDDASHELRSPLTRMRTELEVDQDYPALADAERTRLSVLNEVATLQRLVEDLLQLAKSNDLQGDVNHEPVDLDDLALAEATRLRSISNLRVDTSGVSAAQTVGDHRQLERALRNLGDNAIRHAKTCVTLATSERDGMALLTVSDDGLGVAEHERERVFERFTRLDESRNSEAGGVGLGLAITQDIVRRHHGRIAVEEAPQGGAQFAVSLPSSAQ